jgi:serine/threonine-protein kinase
MMSIVPGTTRFLAASSQASDDPQGDSSPRTIPASFVGSRVGPYLITKRLGAGGVGEVFKAKDVMLKREVAIKVLRNELASDPLFLERFIQEAQLHAKLSHPNVASVHAFLHEGDKQFMVMEYVAGISLDEFVRSGGPVPVERALSIFRRALDGIEHAHQSGIVHRDIKPANIMLADNGQVKVMDFGIARALDSQERLTRFGQVAGTARSMSPEQIRGAQADVRSDIYSLGIVLYTLLAGRPPFDGKTDLALMKAQVEQAPPPLRGLVGNLPPKVEAAVMRALEKDPSARFQTVGAFSRALDAGMAGPTTTPNHFDPATSARTALNPALHGAQASARTVVNPALPGARQPPGGKTQRAAQDRVVSRRPAAAVQGLRRPRRLVVGALGLLTLCLPSAVLVWPHLAEREAPMMALPPPGAVSPPAGEPVAPGPAEGALAQTPAPRVQEPVPLDVVKPAPPIVEPVVPRTLSIARLPSDGEAEAALARSDAAHRFKPDERVRLMVTTSHDAHVYCYLQDETRRIRRFYPNRFNKNAAVKADAPLEIPGKMRFEIVANTRNVAETIACFASERDVMRKLPTAVVGTDFASLPATSLEQVRRAFAAVGDAALTQATFRVDFK